jgi:hypothetical protein
MLSMLIGMISCGSLLSCSGNPPTHYSLGISGDFSDEQKNLIRAAANEWVSGVNDSSELTINVYEGSCNGEGGPGDTCIAPIADMTSYISDHISHADLYGVTVEQDDSIENTSKYPLIYLDIDAMAKDNSGLDHDVLFKTVAAHEIGHSLGLYHTAKGTLMYYSVQMPEVSVTCSDIDYYLINHGFSSRACNNGIQEK